MSKILSILKKLGFFKGKEIKKLKKENELLKNELNKGLEGLNERKINIKNEIVDMNNELNNKRIELDSLIKDIKEMNETSKQTIENMKEEEIRLTNVITKKDKELKELMEKIYEVEDTIETQEYGFLKPKYEFANSDLYKDKLNEIRNKQKQMIKNDTAVHYTQWTVNGSTKEGDKMTRDMIKLTLRSFNYECDNIILTVKFGSLLKHSEKISKLYDSINKLGKHTRVEISYTYYQLKQEELDLAYSYAKKKEEEKEEQRQIREKMKEEAREEELRKAEIKKELDKIAKDEKHFNQELDKLNAKFEKNNDNEQLKKEIEELKAQLLKLEDKKKDIENTKTMNKAGYVYVISNIGSFGENVYKIGMTRRLIPEDRINELSSASVPFKFDIHAMIFSEDAPKLENDIHKLLNEKRVNKINYRKEFFEVPLSEIVDVVNNKLNKQIEFTLKAEAMEYYESLKLK